MPQFEKGNTGKPKGAKDHSWMKVGFWFEELKKDWIKLTPNQRANLSVELMRMLTSKMKALPTDPTDSKYNADEMMKELDQIESKIKFKSIDENGAKPA